MVPRSLLLLAVAIAIPAGEAGSDAFATGIRPLIEQHCGDCHAGPRGKGGITFDGFRTAADVARATPRWEGVLRAVREQHMPPREESQLAPADRQRLVTGLAAVLEGIYDAMPPDPGSVVLHRLSRAEFNNTVRDLLAVDSRPADRFPADGGGGEGFDNNADTLFVPPLLLEKLLDAADELLAKAPAERVVLARPAADTPKDRRVAAKAALGAFAARAWRRPIAAGELDRLLRVWEGLDKRGIAYEPALRHCLKAVLCSPHFVYRVEATKAGSAPYPIGQHELAVRLSYFLWSTMPDDELTRLAGEGRLQDPAVIEEQVRRMLKDPRAEALGEHFAVQWLQLDALRQGGGPDPGVFPEFSDGLRAAMLAEPVAFFNALVARDRSILELIDSDYTFAGGELAALYGAGGGGREPREIRLADRNRGGVLGMAAVLAATSHPQRTSPVLRGRWVLDRLLDDPPPPPPPDVPPLPDGDKPVAATSLRKRLEAHRAVVACAACHDRIDPVGFALENFDPLGRWRDRDGGQPIDSSGTLPDGTKVTGPAALRAALLARKDDVARAFAIKLLGYALGRGIEPCDRPTVKALVATLQRNEHRIVPLIVEIARSYPFRHRRNRTIPVPPPPPAAERKPAPAAERKPGAPAKPAARPAPGARPDPETRP